jgi:hypothetical protein
VHYDSCPLGHSKIESTVRYLGIEVDDALAIAEQCDVTQASRWRQLLKEVRPRRGVAGRAHFDPKRNFARKWSCKHDRHNFAPSLAASTRA